MNNRIATLLLLGVLASSSMLYAAPIKEATLEKLIQLSDIQNVLKSANTEIQPMFDQQAEQIVKQAIAIKTLNKQQQHAAIQLGELMSSMNQQITAHPKFIEMIKKSYRNTFTEEEAQANIEFLSSPLGQSINQKSSKLMGEIMQQTIEISHELGSDPKQKQKFIVAFEKIMHPLLKQKHIK